MFYNNHSRIGKTIAKDVKLNLGGGVEATVNLHLNEEGFLLIEGLGIDSFDYQWHWHKRGDGEQLVELQLLYSEEDEDDWEDD